MIWFRWEFSLKENTEPGFKWSKAEFFVQRILFLVRATFWGKKLFQNKLKYKSSYFVRERYLSAACTLDIINDVSQDTLFRVLRWTRHLVSLSEDWFRDGFLRKRMHSFGHCPNETTITTKTIMTTLTKWLQCLQLLHWLQWREASPNPRNSCNVLVCIYIVFLVLNLLSNLEFRRQK